MSMKHIFSELRLTTHPQKMLCVDILHDLVADDYLSEVDKGKFRINTHGTEMTGTFQRKSNGKNSFLPEDGSDPIFIAERNSAHAMNNDKVKIMFYAKRKHREAEGEVIEILERANDTFVGTLEVAKSYAFLVTENRTLANDIFIPREKLKGGKTGDKAIVKITEWPDKAKNPIGQVIDILGVPETTLPRCTPFLPNSDCPTYIPRRWRKRRTTFRRRSLPKSLPNAKTSVR